MTSSVLLESLAGVPDGVTQRSAVQLSLDELTLLIEALDSYEYWQVGDVLPRHDGMVWIPGDAFGVADRYWEGVEPTEEQADAIEQVRRCREVAERIRVASVDQ